MLYEKFDELKARTGIGTMLMAKNTDGKFSMFIPLESVPSVSSAPESIDIDVTSSDTITKIQGKATMEDKEVEFFLHRDSIRRLMAHKNKTVEFLIVNPDFTGYRFNATISYAQNDATSKDPLKGTIKITPNYDGGFIDNVYDLIQKTAKFVTAVSPVVELEETTGTYEVTIETDPEDATISAESETAGVATVAVSGNKVTVTGVKTGSAVITISTSATDCAPWETTMLVIVP